MSQLAVTVMHWYGSQEMEGAKVEGVYAECPRCGFRVFGRGTDAGATSRCMKRLAALCPRAEGNAYTTEVLPAFQDVS
jgi:DNA-directed RNA polymerase subunit RPC12/RpoP